MNNQPAFATDSDSSPLLEPLLGIHSAPSLSWLADAAASAAQRGLGVLYTLLYVSDASGRLSAVKPASGPQRSVLARLSQTLGTDVAAGKVDPSLKPRLAEALEHGRTVAISGLSDALPQSVDDDQAQAAEIELGVTSVIAAPLQWDGEQFGLLLLLVGPGQSKQTAATELLAGHVAVAIANLNDREAGRKRGEIDAVRWVYDERRFFEELARESRRAQRYHRSLSMMLVRILNLDELRTRYGRFLSERVLRQVAGRLDDAMRDTDFLGASASDGFGAILIEADQEGAKVAETRLLAGLRELQLPESVAGELKIQVACGTATLPQDGETAEELAAAAAARQGQHTATQQDASPQKDTTSAA